MIRILIILILILGSLAVACSVYSQEAKDGGAELMICFDQNDAKELLKRATEHPILIKENEALREKIANLEEQLKLKEDLLKKFFPSETEPQAMQTRLAVWRQ